jgi:hypothetical protein
VITLELSHFIAKFYLVADILCLLLSYKNLRENRSNFIVIALVIATCIFNQYIKTEADFYTFYLVAAITCTNVILTSIGFHINFSIKHSRSTLWAYSICFLIAISYMIIHSVRVEIFKSDEPILWFINAQLAFTLSLYFLSICIFIYGCNIKWKLQFGRLSS